MHGGRKGSRLIFLRCVSSGLPKGNLSSIAGYAEAGLVEDFLFSFAGNPPTPEAPSVEMGLGASESASLLRYSGPSQSPRKTCMGYGWPTRGEAQPYRYPHQVSKVSSL